MLWFVCRWIFWLDILLVPTGGDYWKDRWLRSWGQQNRPRCVEIKVDIKVFCFGMVNFVGRFCKERVFSW